MRIKKEDIPKEMDNEDVIMRETSMGEMNIGYEVFKKEMDASLFFKGLPDGRCQAKHWGYVLKGKFKATYQNHEEIYEEGEVYYLEPGHVPYVYAGTELIEFSPKAEYDKTMEIVAKNMADMQEG